MKSFIKTSGTIMLLCCFLCVFPMSSFADEGHSHTGLLEKDIVPFPGKKIVIGPPKPVGEHFPAIPASKVRTLDSKSVILKFDVLRAVDEKIKGLDAFLGKQGFQAGGECKDCSGAFQFTSKVNNDLLLEPGDPRGNEVVTTLYLQEYNPTGSSSDKVSIAHVTIKSGEHKETHSFALIAPGGNFDEVAEYKFVDGQIERTHSWWSCLRAKLVDCACSDCKQAMISCDQSSWWGQVWCVVWRCGGCWAKAVACCTCNDRWWCNWAVGSCRQ